MKLQILVIHGGCNFGTYDEYLNFLKNDWKVDLASMRKTGWKRNLQKHLTDFDVLLAEMPNRMNAKFAEWKIMFDKIIPLLDDQFILIGHSLGGIFLTKYLSENKIDKKIIATYLVAAPFDDKDSDEKIYDFSLTSDLTGLEKQVGEVVFMYSKDDRAVPFIDLAKYQKALPNARTVVFEDRGHFNQEEFPELVEDIKSLVK